MSVTLCSTCALLAGNNMIRSISILKWPCETWLSVDQLPYLSRSMSCSLMRSAMLSPWEGLLRTSRSMAPSHQSAHPLLPTAVPVAAALPAPGWPVSASSAPAPHMTCLQCWPTVPVPVQCLQRETCVGGCCDACLVCIATQGQARVGIVQGGVFKCKVLCEGGGGAAYCRA